MKRIICLSAIILLSSFTFDPQEYEFIKIINLMSKPIIEGSLNGKIAYFLLDTGSDLTILNSKDSDKYNFKVVLRDLSGNRVVSFGGFQTDILDAYKTNLQLGSQLINNTRIYSYDLTPIINSLYQHSNIKISGIIGSNIMKKYGFVIDYTNQEVGIKMLAQKKPKKL